MQLREWLAVNAPHLLGTKPVQGCARGWSGVAELDRQVGSNWPGAGLIEWVRPLESAGATSLLAQVALQRGRGLVGWVDRDQLDVESFPPGWLARLVWVRAGDELEAVRSAELLVRDGNFDPVVLDLGEGWWRVQARLPTGVWFRLGQVARQAGVRVVAVVPGKRNRVSGARLRVWCQGRRGVEEIGLSWGEGGCAAVRWEGEGGNEVDFAVSGS